jgi:hypothetical protein
VHGYHVVVFHVVLLQCPSGVGEQAAVVVEVLRCRWHRWKLGVDQSFQVGQSYVPWYVELQDLRGACGDG